MKTKIGVQLYSVKDAMAEDMPKTLKRIKEIGFDAVEFYGGATYSAEEIVKELQANDLEICGWHTPWACVQDDFLQAWIAYCKAIGNKNIIIPWLPEECRESVAAWKETANKFNSVSKELKKHGMRIGYHNHNAEFIDLEGEKPWDVFLNATCEDVIAQNDIGNSMEGTGVDGLAYFEKYVNRGVTVHAKAHSETVKIAAIGEDDIDWVRYAKAIKDTGVTEYCIVEYENEGVDSFEKLVICYNTLKELL